MRKPYRTDLTDQQWKLLKPLIPPALPGGRPRQVDLREIINTLLSQARTGCQGDLLPHDRLPKSTVWDSCAQGRDEGTWPRLVAVLPKEVRGAEGREPRPRGASLDRPRVQTTEVGGERGDDGGQKTSRRKRHLGFEARGLWLAVGVTAAAAEDGATAPRVRGLLERPGYPRLEVVSGDGKSHNREWDDWRERSKAPFGVEVVERPAGETGFVKLPKRWVAERSFAWLGRDRRQSQDSEWYPESSVAWVRISAMGGMRRRLGPDEMRKSAPLMYRRRKAA
jgi:putative transposase